MTATIRFGLFELDVSTAELHHNGRRTRLPEQQFKILEMLLTAHGSLVSRDEIRKRLWPNDTVVELDRSINAAIKNLRTTLNDSASSPLYIETVARRGYRIMVQVQIAEPAQKPNDAARIHDGGLAGKKLSHYRVLELLGGGGMGLVYKAEDLKLHRRVALKFLPEEMVSDSRAIRRFEREARAASALNHENICTIYGVEEHRSQPFIVMELLEGESLRELISGKDSIAEDRRGLGSERLIQIGIQIAEGLAAAHQEGIVHRDIKPANIFVTTRGQVKILDFGLAQVARLGADYIDSEDDQQSVRSKMTPMPDVSADQTLSRTGIAMGTAGYMSPEQVRGETLDCRTDLYSFGLILFEMATGVRAFRGDTAAHVYDAILHHEVPSVREVNPDLPIKLEEIIGRALQKNRESRFQTAAEILADLKSTLATNQAESVAVTVASRLSTRKLLVLATTLLLTLTGLLAWYRRDHVPRGQFHQIQLTTNSGDDPVTSAGISGDGKYLLYADNASVHIKSLETGETRDIPHPLEFGKRHIFWEFHWFPDNVRFLAVSSKYPNERTTWLGSAMSGALRRLRDDAAAWDLSPDGSRIVFSPDGNRELWVMNGSGESAQRLFDAGDASEFDAVQWSPDGARLLDLRESEISGRVVRAIELRDLKGSAPTILLTDDRLRDLHWLRDGRILYLLGQPGYQGEMCDFWAARLKSGAAAFAGKPEQVTHSDGFCMGHPSSTNDGRKLVFRRYTRWNTIEVANLDLGGKRITPPRHFSELECPEFPDGWTADSREVIFSSKRDQTWEVYRRPLVGGPATLVRTKHAPDENIGFVITSPDGNWIFYFRYPNTKGAPFDLMKAPLAGGEPSTIFSGSFLGNPRCSHAPANLCVVGSLNKDELVVTRFDAIHGRGSELARIPVVPHQPHGWALSPDGRLIAVQQGGATFDLFEWKTGKRKTVKVDGWTMLMTMDWAPDGSGLFMSTVEPASNLLHVDLNGRATVLWEPKGTYVAFTIGSPDGRHVAMQAEGGSSNAWMIQNF
jgi:serine/threonine protein kinase